MENDVSILKTYDATIARNRELRRKSHDSRLRDRRGQTTSTLVDFRLFFCDSDTYVV